MRCRGATPRNTGRIAATFAAGLPSAKVANVPRQSRHDKAVRQSMQGSRFATGPFARAVLLLAALASCSIMPRSGPSAGSHQGRQPRYRARHARGRGHAGGRGRFRSSETLGFDSSFVNAPVLSPDTIRPGDTLSVQVWENVDTGLLVGVGQKATELRGAAGRPEGQHLRALRRRGARRRPEPRPAAPRSSPQSLAGQTPDPQVEVRRVAGDGATVSVMGGVEAPGVFPIQAPTLRLSAMLALAGGVVLVPDVAQIKIERDGRTGRIWLQDLYDKPSYDIALRGGDRIIVEEDRRTFTALGATVGQARVPFNKRNMTRDGGDRHRRTASTAAPPIRQRRLRLPRRAGRGRQPRARPHRPRRSAADGLPARPGRGPRASSPRATSSSATRTRST